LNSAGCVYVFLMSDISQGNTVDRHFTETISGIDE